MGFFKMNNKNDRFYFVNNIKMRKIMSRQRTTENQQEKIKLILK